MFFLSAEPGGSCVGSLSITAVAKRTGFAACAILTVPPAFGAVIGFIIIVGVGCVVALISMTGAPGGGAADEAASLNVANERAGEVFSMVMTCWFLGDCGLSLIARFRAKTMATV